jgi:ketosteroid isomerase-like protein
MSEENVNVVQRSYEAFGRGDIPAVSRRWLRMSSGSSRTRFRGAAPIAAMGGSPTTGRASGGEFDVGVAHVWTVRGGKAERVESYLDTAEVLRALGR